MLFFIILLESYSAIPCRRYFTPVFTSNAIVYIQDTSNRTINEGNKRRRKRSRKIEENPISK